MSWVRVELGDVQSMARDSASPNPKVSPYLGLAAGHAKMWSAQEPNAVEHDSGKVVAIDRIMSKLKRSPPDRALEMTFEGVFFPALLLFSGWWARKHGRKLAEAAKWNNGLQHWLFRGFEQWAPSWQLSDPAGQDEPYLFGQIGAEGDEADSVGLIVAGSKAEPLREELGKGHRAFGVRATGTLCHRRNVADPEIKNQLRLWGKSFQFCLILSAAEKGHGVKPLNPVPSFYSGYLWRCVLPKSLAVIRHDPVSQQEVIETPRLHDVYFLWEHTDLTKPDTVAYNLDSLEKKEAYLRSRLGEDELILLQKSSDLIPGAPRMLTEKFYQFIST